MPTYHVIVPVDLELELISDMDAEHALDLVMRAFAPGNDDPLLGANVRLAKSFQVSPRNTIAVARTRRATLSGRVVVRRKENI